MVTVDVAGGVLCPPSPLDPDPVPPQAHKEQTLATKRIAASEAPWRHFRRMHQQPSARANEEMGANGNSAGCLRLLALAATEIVSVEEPPGVAEVGEKLHDAPAGNPEQANDTDPVNPSMADTRIPAVPVPPL